MQATAGESRPVQALRQVFSHNFTLPGTYQLAITVPDVPYQFQEMVLQHRDDIKLTEHDPNFVGVGSLRQDLESAVTLVPPSDEEPAPSMNYSPEEVVELQKWPLQTAAAKRCEKLGLDPRVQHALTRAMLGQRVWIQAVRTYVRKVNWINTDPNVVQVPPLEDADDDDEPMSDSSSSTSSSSSSSLSSRSSERLTYDLLQRSGYSEEARLRVERLSKRPAEAPDAEEEPAEKRQREEPPSATS